MPERKPEDVPTLDDLLKRNSNETTVRQFSQLSVSFAHSHTFIYILYILYSRLGQVKSEVDAKFSVSLKPSSLDSFIILARTNILYVKISNKFFFFFFIPTLLCIKLIKGKLSGYYYEGIYLSLVMLSIYVFFFLFNVIDFRLRKMFELFLMCKTVCYILDCVFFFFVVVDIYNHFVIFKVMWRLVCDLCIKFIVVVTGIFLWNNVYTL